MIHYFLSRLKIEGFRGINNEGDPLELKFKVGDVNSVFARNASGKSSLFEALCFAIKGDIPKLRELQAADRADDYYVNRFHSGGKASIEIDFTSSETPPKVCTVIVTRDSAGTRTVSSPSGHTDPEGLLSSLNEAFTLLDYASFTKFTEDTPLRRGRSFASLLGLSEYSNYRQSLQSLSDTRAIKNDLGVPALEAAMQTLSRATPGLLVRAQAAYRELLGTAIDDSADLTVAATEVSTALRAIPLISPFLDSVELEDVDFGAVTKALEAEEGGAKRTRFQVIQLELEQLEHLEPDETIEADFQDLIAGIKNLEKLLAQTQGDHYKHLMEAAQVLVENDGLADSNVCPICGTNLDQSIESIVRGKLTQYSAVESQIAELNARWVTSSFGTLFGRLEQSPLVGLERQEHLASRAHELIQSGAITEAAMSAFYEHFGVLLQAAQDKKVKLVTEKAALEKDLPPSLVALNQQADAGRRFRDVWLEHAKNRTEYEDANTKLSNRLAWIEFMSKTVAAFADAESRMTSSKISTISSDYKEMFAAIMHTGNIVPELKRPVASEELRVELTDFHGLRDVSARAVLSESYRNALAISVFLSAARRHVSPPRFIVLDDVTSSFDSGHQYFLMEYIRNHLQYGVHADGLQFIILSHDGQLEKYFDRLGGVSGWHHQRLQGAPPVGAVVSQPQGSSRLEAIARDFLNAGQVDQAEPLIRQYFEFKLTEIIRKLGIPVPIDFAMKDHVRMVSGSIKAIQDAIDLHKAAGDLILDGVQESNFKNHHVTGIISNWVSHYETSASTSLAAPVLLKVLDDINRLPECFQHDVVVNGVTTKSWYRSLSSI